jgi:hypothetical protein
MRTLTRGAGKRSGGRRLRLAILAGLAPLALAAFARAGGVDSTMLPYQEARAAGRVGSLEARALTDAQTPSLPPVPVAGVTVALLPWSADVQARLEAVKAGSRDSMKAYLGAVSAVRGVLSAWGENVSAGGGQDLVRHSTTDSGGAVRFADVPAGDWLLVAWRSEAMRPARSIKPRRDDANFAAGPAATGYTVVSVWQSRVAVSPGQAAEIALTDRGVWLSGVDTQAEAQAPPAAGTGLRLRR